MFHLLHTVYLSRLCICPFRFWTLWGMSFETKISKLFSRYFRNQIKFLFILICLILAKPKIAICYYDFIYWCFLANFNIHTHKIMIGRHEVGIQLKIKLFFKTSINSFLKGIFLGFDKLSLNVFQNRVLEHQSIKLNASSFSFFIFWSSA